MRKNSMYICVNNDSNKFMYSSVISSSLVMNFSSLVVILLPEANAASRSSIAFPFHLVLSLPFLPPRAFRGSGVLGTWFPCTHTHTVP